MKVYEDILVTRTALVTVLLLGSERPEPMAVPQVPMTK